MFFKKIKFIFIIFILYQTPLYSKINRFENFDARNLSKYFSGIGAFQNKNNSDALDFFNSSKILLEKHDPYLKKYVYSLVLENKVSHAINVIKNRKNENNSDFFEKNLLLILDSLNKDDLNKAYRNLKKMSDLSQLNTFNKAILESLNQYIYVFKEKRFLDNKKSLG